MAFDCYCIDFQNKKSKENINKLKQIFPYVKVLPFIQSYYDLSKVVLLNSEKSVNNQGILTQHDLEYQEQRRRRKVRKLTFEER